MYFQMREGGGEGEVRRGARGSGRSEGGGGEGGGEEGKWEE